MMDEDFDIREERFSQGEKDFENALRPLSFTPYCTVLQDWVKPHFRISLPTSWV